MCAFHYVSIYLLLVFNTTFNKCFGHIVAVSSWWTIADPPPKANDLPQVTDQSDNICLYLLQLSVGENWTHNFSNDRNCLAM